MPQITRMKVSPRAIHPVSVLLLASALCPAYMPPSQETPNQQNRSGEASSKTQRDVRSLAPGQTLRREIAPGENHYYEVTLEAGQYVQFILMYYRAANLRVFLPDGREAPHVNASFYDLEGLYGIDQPMLAEISGTYRAEVWNPADGEQDPYELWVSQPRAATDRDRMRVAAMKANWDLGRLHSEVKAESYLRSIERGKEAARLWRELGETRYEIHALYLTGESCEEIGQYAKALEYFNGALSLCVSSGYRGELSDVLVSMGQTYQYLSEYQRSLDFYRQALPLCQGDRPDFVIRKAWTLDNIGAAYHSLGDNQQALENHREAARIYSSFSSGRGDPRGMAHAFTRIGEVLASMGDKQSGLDYLDRALPNWRLVPDAWGEARVFHRMGDIYASLGDSEKAFDSYNQALARSGETGDPEAEAATINGIGNLYLSLGEIVKALDHFNRALEIKRNIGQSEGEAQSLTQIGDAYYSMRDWQKALDYHNYSLAIWKAIGNPNGEARALSGIGDVYRALGNATAALDYYNKALPLRRAVQDREGEANTLYGIARAERDRGDSTKACASISQAIELVERIRTSVGSGELRASYLGKVRDYYELKIDLLMRQEPIERTGARSAEALHVSERARARVLLELLASAGANIREGVDPALLERERGLRQKLDGKASYRTSLLMRKHSNEEAAALDAEIKGIDIEYQRVQSQIRAVSPRYAALTQPEPLTAGDIQKLLDSNTLLLEYALGEKNSYLWVVGDRSMSAYRLPGRVEIENAARRVYELLAERNRRVKDETATERRARVARADRYYDEASAVLSRMVLGPAASELGNKRLLTVADGALQYVPFAALPAPVVRRTRDPIRGWGNAQAIRDIPSQRITTKSQPLIVAHEIVSLPSASALALLRRELKNRRPAPKTLALLADPVFSSSDPRVHAATVNVSSQHNILDSTKPSDAAARVASRDLQRALRDVGEADSTEDLPRLLGTRWEAEQIALLIPESEGMIALNFAANREMATRPELGNYQIVHFASHALIDTTHPELSGIVLSLVDEQGNPRDGFLRAHEVFNLKLNADLVVLNACRTGLGKEVRGEGLIGLTRGFMYAGAARVLVSLWSLEDRSASELMKRMYEKMLGPMHLSPSAALRAAQIEMWKQPGLRSPYFWAGYSLQGEWK